MVAKTSDASEEEALRQFTTLPESVKYSLSTTRDMCIASLLVVLYSI